MTLVALVLLAGCGAGGGAVVETKATEVVALAAASDFVVGENRFPFALFTQQMEFVSGSEVEVEFFMIGKEGAEPRFGGRAVYREVAEAGNHVHEEGEEDLHGTVEGVYVVDGVKFDEAGFWRVELTVTMPVTGVVEHPTMALEVLAEPMAIGVGEAAPRSRNLTADGREPGEITTMSEPVPEFYEETVVEALVRGRPLVVAFASPVFCVSRMCGPVMEVVARVHADYGGRVGFIHVEPYDLELARTEGRLDMVETAREWRLPTEPWVFVVGGNGRVTARFEGLFAAEELAAELERGLR